ncbi:MAG: hypothetical protein WCO18_01075 [bacterium]
MNDDDNKDPFLKDKDDVVDADLIDGEADLIEDDILDEDIVEPDEEEDEAPLWEEEE